MIRRNDFSVLNHAVATQRNTIESSRQRLTRPVRWCTPECGDSMTLVVYRQRRSVAGKPKRFTVNVSAKPSRRLAAALAAKTGLADPQFSFGQADNTVLATVPADLAGRLAGGVWGRRAAERRGSAPPRWWPARRRRSASRRPAQPARSARASGAGVGLPC